MKRRMICICTLLCMLVQATAMAENTSTTELVSTADELRAAILANKNIRLTADIDFTNVDWSPIPSNESGPYTGTIDGTVDFNNQGTEKPKPEQITYMTDENDNTLTTKNENQEDVPIPFYMHRLLNLQQTLFLTLNGATVKNLIIEGANYKAVGINDDTNGVLCLDAVCTTFTNIVFDDCKINDGNILSNANNIGLIAGSAERCTLTDITASRCDIKGDGNRVGSLVGKAAGTAFTNCVTDGTTSIYGNSMADARTGGICGQASSYEKEDGTTIACSFTDCANYAMIGTGEKADMIGGIVGYSEGSTFSGCRNYGFVAQMRDDNEWAKYKQNVIDQSGVAATIVFGKSAMYWRWIYDALDKLAKTYAGGLDEEIELSAKFFAKSRYANYSNIMSMCYVAAALEVLWLIYQYQDPDEVGGICGSAKGGRFDGCSNHGAVRCLDAYSGGIVGYAKNVTIADCLNTGNIYGNEQTGGIVGTLTGASSLVEYCLNTGVYFAEKATNGPIYGELASGAKSSATHYVIAPANNPTHTTGNYTYVNKEVLASGAVAKMLFDNGRTIWGQKIGTGTDADATPIPDATLPKAGDEGNAIGSNNAVWVEVGDAAGLRNALTDSYAWIRLTADITLGDADYNFMTHENPFCGCLDGAHHVINGSNINRTITEDAHDQDPCGIFTYADGALFKDIDIELGSFTGNMYVGALVGKSSNATYQGVRLTRCALLQCWGEGCGGLVGVSDHDTFWQCSIGNAVDRIFCDGFSLGNANLGGIAGQATGSTFTFCTNNAAHIQGNDDHVGGIVGYATACAFTLCTNNGYVQHYYTGTANRAWNDELGGIVGYAEKCTIDRCTNDFRCWGGDAYVGGIVGYATHTDITNCLNTHEVHGDELTGAIAGHFDNGNINNCLTTGSVFINYGNENVNGMKELFGEAGDNAHWSNNYIYITNGTYNPGSGGRALVTGDELRSGKVAWWLNESKESDDPVWHQNLTEGNEDRFPVLDTTHGIVHSTSFETIVIINDEDELRAFATTVNGFTGRLSEDIIGVLAADIKLTKPWIPIGNTGHAFRGKFQGNNHMVSNMNVTSVGQSEHMGFFGEVGSGAIISDLIVDGTVGDANSTVSGIAGIVGAAEDTLNQSGTVQILRCGNMADVSNNAANAAGIIGAVYSNPNLELIVRDCWNTGNIHGGKESAYLCANTKLNATFTNCWNTGELTIADASTKYYVRQQTTNLTNPVLTISNCFQLETLTDATQDGLSTFTASQLADGSLCARLNDNAVSGNNLIWQQNLGTDTQPVFGEAGLYHTRSMTNTYGTVCLPFAIASNDEVQYYVLSAADVNAETPAIVFEPTGNVAAGTPCLFKKLDESTTVTIKPASNGDYTAAKTITPIDNWTIKGTYSALENQQSTGSTSLLYIAANQLWYAEDPISIPAYRAWLEYAGSMSASSLSIRIGDATGIENVNGNGNGNENGNVIGNIFYDLSGRRMSDETTLAPGIYIVGGRKVLVH